MIRLILDFVHFEAKGRRTLEFAEVGGLNCVMSVFDHDMLLIPAR
jgi:hypothetical protein